MAEIDCTTCHGAGCDHGCGRCQHANDGPDSHKVCRACDGMGVREFDQDYLLEQLAVVLANGGPVEDEMDAAQAIIDHLDTIGCRIVKITTVPDELDRLRESEHEYAFLTGRMSHLLTQTANALKGPPGPLTLHDWSDLPYVARRVMAELRRHRNRNARG